ncbi:Sorting nexin-12 [Tyrophagus putrescentiae]|nr:Sorting nexin-12 [Tyrophagus putrescentiae]
MTPTPSRPTSSRLTCSNPVTHGIARNRYTDYEVRMRSNLPIFKLKESIVRRRYSDFEWLRNELERDSKIVGIFEEEFIEERKRGLEQFINKVAGHPLAQNEKCLHMFLQDPLLDKGYSPGKIRSQ